MDARAQQAREYHKAASSFDDRAEQYRHGRNQLVRALRSEDPVYWSYGKLAAAVGCSRSLIAQILGPPVPPVDPLMKATVDDAPKRPL